MSFTLTLTTAEYFSLIRLLQDCIGKPDCDKPWHKVISNQNSLTLLGLLKKIDPDFKYTEKAILTDTELESALAKAGFFKSSHND